MRARTVFAAAALLCAAAVAPARAAPTALEGIAPFTAVEARHPACTPFSVLVVPGDAPSVAVDAEPGVAKALRATTTADGVLQLTTQGAFSSSTPVKVTVTLPGADLRAVYASGSGSVVVGSSPAGGFAPSDSLTLGNRGSGVLHATGLNASVLSITSAAAGGVVAGGTLGRVTVSQSGNGWTVVSGVSQAVTANVDGLGALWIAPTSAETVIQGAVSGMASIRATQGRCMVQSQFGSFFGPPCMQVPAFNLPAAPSWSGCGLAVDGDVTCEGARGIVAYSGGAGAAPGGGVVVGNGGGVAVGGGAGGPTFVGSSAGPGGSGIMYSGGGGGGSFVSSSSGNGGTFVGGGPAGSGVFVGGAGGAGGPAFFSTGGAAPGYAVFSGTPGGGVYVNGQPVPVKTLQAPTCKVAAKDLAMFPSA